MERLPVDDCLPQVVEAFRNHSCLILQAPPGSGKTTRVAPYVLEHLALENSSRIQLLQPRRVAARATAERIAFERGWRLGDKVGYQVRFESRFHQQTPLLVSTEGILLRRIQADPILEDIGMVLFDEFHERTIAMDLLLGMIRRIQSSIRPDLKLLIMSATLATESLQAYLDGAPVIEAQGVAYPVELSYRPPALRQNLVEHVVETILHSVHRSKGDLLVFLPGVGEIQRTMQSLRSAQLSDWDILPLHGRLPLEEQNRTLRSGQRPRIVLATNVAETSLTLQGIRTVIDSGQVRVLRFDPSIGLDRLELEPICQASATQRAGRAGRTASGYCVRLWDAQATSSRPEYLEPEIRRLDITGTLLQLYEWGEGAGQDFPWLLAPRAESIAAGVALLQRLGALDGERVTETGRVMARLPIAPRLARLLIEGHRFGHLDRVALMAAMLAEREPFLRDRSSGTSSRGMPTQRVARWDSDVVERLLAVERFLADGQEASAFGVIHRGATKTIVEVAQQLTQDTLDALGPLPSPNHESEEAMMRALLVAFPDRLAKRRQPNQSRGLMVGGKGVVLAAASGVTEPELFLCIDVEGGGSEAMVRQASLVREEWLDSSLIASRDEMFFHPTQKQVVARRRRYFDDLLLSEMPIASEGNEQAQQVLFEAAKAAWDQVFPADQTPIATFCQRVECLRSWVPELDLPKLDQEAFMELLWELCRGKRTLAELRTAPWLDWLRMRFTPEQWRAIEDEAPERMTVPSGSAIRIEYEVGKPPILAVRIQEVFSWKATPRIARGRVPLLLHLLAPNMRPQQVTDDLGSFWANTYAIVRKELRRRYPKHAWPEDPLTALPVKKG